MGAPGAGKGKQANYSQGKITVFPLLFTGDMLRAVKAGTPLGVATKTIMDVHVRTTSSSILAKERIKEADCAERSMAFHAPYQAQSMKDAGIPIDYVVEIDVADSDMIDRMSGRRAPGRTYHSIRPRSKARMT